MDYMVVYIMEYMKDYIIDYTVEYMCNTMATWLRRHPLLPTELPTTIYSVYPTKLSLIPQFYDVRPTYGSIFSRSHGGGLGLEKRFHSSTDLLERHQDKTQSTRRSRINSLLVRRQLPNCPLWCSAWEK